MDTNPVTESDDVLDAMLVHAMAGGIEDVSEEELSLDTLQARTGERFKELSMPLREGVENYYANTISATLLEVAYQEVLTDGAEQFSVEKVVDESMTKLERILGAPKDREGAKSGIRAYIDAAHRLENRAA